MNLVGPINMIVSEAIKKNSSDVFSILDPDSGGAETFSVALSPSGGANATHWGTRTHLEEETLNALTTMNIPEFKAYVDQVSTVRGRTPLGSVTAFKNGVTLDQTMGFWEFATSQGLQAVAAPV